jgi:hypothetical protein
MHIGLTQDCAMVFSENNPPKTLGTRVNCKTGTGLGGQRARRAQGRLDEHRAIHT